MRVYATELICCTGGLGLQPFKPVFCMYNKLRLDARISSQWVNDVIFSRSNPLMSYRSVLSVGNGGPWNPKLTLKINSLRIKHKAQNFASWTFSKYAFKIERKKKWFFYHSTTLTSTSIQTNKQLGLFFLILVRFLLVLDIPLNYLVILPPTQHHSFFKNLAPFTKVWFSDFIRLARYCGKM